MAEGQYDVTVGIRSIESDVGYYVASLIDE